jgi:hypothetical protein
MISPRRWLAGPVVALGVLIPTVTVMGTPAVGLAGQESPRFVAAESRHGPLVVVRAGSQSAPTLVPRDAATDVGATAATFQVTFTGFTPEAQAAFQRAVDLWAPTLNSTVPITVSASFEELPPGILGAARSNFFHRNFVGAPTRNTWYPDVIANKRAGRQLRPAPDILAAFSSSRTDWHFDISPAPAGTIDFTTVVLHELGHGVGFAGAGNLSGTRGSVRAAGFPFSFDRFTETAPGRRLMSVPDNSRQLGTLLRSNNLRFDSRSVRRANGGQPARIYAPRNWQPGSSYSHLNEATYPPGNAHSLMTPVINAGETIRSPGAITTALLVSIGW